MPNKQNLFPSIDEILLEIPLYTEFELNEVYTETLDFLQSLYLYGGPLTCFCSGCNDESIFRGKPNDLRGHGAYILFKNRQFTITLSCMRDHSHHPAQFHFLVHDKILTKIGQYPSIASISVVEIKRFRKILNKIDYDEFSKAVGLASHGIGIGSFVYLRRIFERIILKAFEENKDQISIGHDDFIYKDMKEKIEILKNFLPSYLVENKVIYGIMSSGIHSLDEDICKKAFPIIKTGFEFILLDKMRKYEEQKARKENVKALNQLVQKLKD